MPTRDNKGTHNRKSTMLRKLAPAALSAGILLSQTPASADPLVQRLLDEAVARAASAGARRDDEDSPVPLVLKAATGSTFQIWAGHTSHRSHASHVSGSSDYNPSYTPSPRQRDSSTSPSAPTTPPPATTPKPKPAAPAVVPKVVRLNDGSELVGVVTSSEDKVSLKSEFGTFEFKAEEVQSTKASLLTPGFASETKGGSVVTLKTGKMYHGDKEGEDGTVSVIVGGNSINVSEDKVQTVQKITRPPASWSPSASKWFWITLRDGSTVRATVAKKDDDWGLTFRYGTIRAKKDDFLIVKKADEDSASSSQNTKAESPGHKDH